MGHVSKDLPPRSTVNDYFRRWSEDGTLDRIYHTLYVQCRELAGREASPTAAIIDSQSVKSAEKGGPSIDPHGYDAGKASTLTGTDPLLLIEIDPASAHWFVVSRAKTSRYPTCLKATIPLFDRGNHSSVPTWVPRDMASAGGQ